VIRDALANRRAASASRLCNADEFQTDAAIAGSASPVAARDFVGRRDYLLSIDSHCGIFATLGNYFARVIGRRRFSFPMSRTYNRFGGVHVSIETLILILILTFAVGFVLNRFDPRRHL
jgi:hypothetical protein